ncbi:LacI family DNA-binding transcriptional regulator [Brevibacillus sp. B_LB10_24]|uniref:LacI family DNA-binding transcriptional regulator n=1 Tax=Brevibacillus sp. B_LB10_24 TaxID=3380645 RepID=UPI0038BAD699
MVTSKDVAKHAGVSQATVSRVLNGYPGIKQETKDKVMQAMAELHYRPNFIARSLVMNQTRNIALLSGTLKNHFFVETTDNIVRLAAEKGYSVMVHFEHMGDNLSLFETISRYKPDGIILSTIQLDDPLLPQLEEANIPYMMFNRRPRTGGNYVVIDNRLAGELNTRHLIEYGHKRIAFLSGHLNVSTFFERKEGYEATLKKYGLQPDPQLMVMTNGTPQEIEVAAVRLMQLSSPPTAIICATDAMALTCMDVLIRMGKRIPEDVSICGVDDIDIASHQSIRLTTVGNYKQQMGVLAIEMLMNLIEAEEEALQPIQIVLRPELIVRETTGACPP